MSSLSDRFNPPLRIARDNQDDSREIDLFRRAQSGDRGAFGQLAIRLQDRLFNSILRVVGNYDEARELTQETFVKALSKIETFRGESKPYTWLFRIGLNLAISHLRTVQRRRVFSLDAPRRGATDSEQAAGLAERLAGGDETPDQALQRHETRQQVVAAMGQLDVETRALLVMRDVDGLDYQQMAEIFSVPLGTLKSRLFRARLALREQLLRVNKELGSS